MPLSEDWKEMAEHSLKSTDHLLADTDEAFVRSTISRAYYAAYQAATAMLNAAGNTPPTVKGVQREGWDHTQTPDMLRTSLWNLPITPERRRRMRTELGELYKMRCASDYESAQTLTVPHSKKARQYAGRMIKAAQGVIS